VCVAVSVVPYGPLWQPCLATTPPHQNTTQHHTPSNHDSIANDTSIITFTRNNNLEHPQKHPLSLNFNEILFILRHLYYYLSNIRDNLVTILRATKLGTTGK